MQKTTIRLSPLDERNVKRIQRAGYATTTTGAIRSALAFMAAAFDGGNPQHAAARRAVAEKEGAA